MKVRLQKFLAEAGLGSRRYCEQLITAGRATIDGQTATLGDSVDPEEQSVEFDGAPLQREHKEYWLLNKPAGVVSTASDPQGRPTVLDSIPTTSRVFPVGRLDLASTGLLVITNDGELAAHLLHPRYHVEKEYRVLVEGTVSGPTLHRLRGGVELEDGPTLPAQIELISQANPAIGRPTSELKMVIREGRKRQVRRMLESVGHPVLALHRSRFGGLEDADLPVGRVRPLTPAEVESLRRAGGVG